MRSPMIDLYTEGYDEFGEAIEDADVRFSFGDSPFGMFSLTVACPDQGEVTVHISREVIGDLHVIDSATRSQRND